MRPWSYRMKPEPAHPTMGTYRIAVWPLLALALLLAGSAGVGAAGGAAVREIGEYAVHYNAMPASALDAELAARYGLPRSEERCVVTVAVVHRETGAAVEAAVMGSATRPDGRMHHLDMRQVRDNEGVYYVAALPLEASATLEFKLEVRPRPSMAPQTIRFSREFTGGSEP